MRNRFRSSLFRCVASLIVLSGCATSGPLVEVCVLDSSSVNPKFWHADCELRQGEETAVKTDKQRTLNVLDKYLLMSSEDMKLLLNFCNVK